MAKNANLGSLNFELVLKDEQFNSAVKSATEAAKNLNTTLSNLLDFRKKVTDAAGVTDKLAKSLREEANQLDNGNKKLTTAQKLLRDYNREKKKLQRTFGFTDDFAKQNALLGQLSTAAMRYVSIWGAASFVRSIAEVTGEFELQRMTLRAMLKDANAADKVYNRIWDLALKSPFNAKELVTYAKQLVAYSIPIGEIYDTTKMLADVSSGLGVGMDRLVLAYGQIRSASFLRGQEVRQLTEAGIPILEELRKQFVALGEETITVGDVFDKISNRLVPFEMVQKVFQNMTSEGGKFFNMQEKQAETLKGKIMILKDAYDKMLNSIGSDNSDMFKGAIDSITDLMHNYEKVVAILKTVIIGYGSYRAALALVYTIEKSMIAINYIKYWVNLKRAIEQTGRQAHIFARICKSLGLSLKTLAPIVGVLVAIGSAIAIAVNNAHKLGKELECIKNTQFNDAAKSAEDFKRIASNISEATKGSQNFRDAISELNSKYGEYLPNLLSENNALTELEANYNSVTNAIYAKAKAYAYSEGIRNIEDNYGKKQSRYIAQMRGMLTSFYGLDKDQANLVIDNFIIAVKDEKNKFKKVGEIISEVFTSTLESGLVKYSSNMMIKERVTDSFTKSYVRLAGTIREAAQAVRDFQDTLDARFSNTSYSSEKEMRVVEKWNAKYKEWNETLKANTQLTAEQVKVEQDKLEKRRISNIINEFRLLEEQAARVGKEGSYIALINKYKDEWNKKIGQIDLSALQKTVNDIIGNNQYGQIFKVDANDNLFDYAEKLRSEYEKIIKNYNDAKQSVEGMIKAEGTLSENERAVLENNKKLLEQETQRKDLAEQIAAALHVTLVETKTGGSSGGVPEKLSMTISTLKDIYSWYEKLIAIMDDSTAKNVLASFFPEHKDIIMLGGYKEQLLALADALEVYDKKASQALRNDVNGNNLQNYYEQLKSANEQIERLQKLLDNFNGKIEVSGTGVRFDMSKVVKQYKQDISDIEKYAKEIRENLQNKNLANVDASKIFDYEEFVNNLSIGENNALATAKDALDSLAKAWVEDWAKMKGVDIKNWGGMTVSQLRQIRDMFSSLFDENGNIADIDMLAELENLLGDIPGATEEFVKSIKKVILGLNEENGADGLLGKLFPKLGKKQAREIKYIADEMLELADAVTELAQATGNANLESISSGLSKIGDVANSAAAGFQATGSWIGAVIGGVSSIAKQLINSYAESAKLAREINNSSLANIVEEWEKSLDGSDEVFGENLASNIKNALSVIEDATKKADEILSKITDKVGNTLEVIAKWPHMLSAYGYQQLYKSIEQGNSLFESYLINSGTTLKQAADSLNLSLYDAYGDIDYEALLKIIEAYDSKINAESKDSLTALANYCKAVKEAKKEIESVVSDLAGSIADSAADKIIDQWVEMGNAALDYSDILNEVTKAYAKMMIKQALLDSVFDESFKAQLKEYTANLDSVKAVALIEQKLAEINGEAMQNFVNGVLTPLSDYFSGSSSNTLGSGIKSITEDTANLLASYLNGMRADLAMQRVSVDAIKELLTAHIPTLEDYMAQIQANTYDTAVATQRILANMDSMMTSEAGATAFRVFTI